MAGGVRVTVYAAQAIAEARRISTPKRVEVAGQMVNAFRGSAPVETGEYRDGSDVETSGDRVAFVNNDPEAGWKEFGTSTSPAHGAMVSAARRFGRYSGMTP